VLTKDLADSTELEVAEASVLKIGNEYKMWYLSTAQYTGPGSETFRIKYATSNDGTNWTRQGYVLRRRDGVGWESEGVLSPTVLYVNGEYKMWYGTRDSVGVGKIGYASSTDGINWNRLLNPVLQTSLSWEGTSVGAPSVYFDGQNYHIYYHAGPIVPYYIGHATSTDGINWTKDANYVLGRGGFAAFDQNMIAAPDVIRVANKLRLYYAGLDTGSVWRVGLAEETAPIPYFSQSDPLWGGNTYDHMDATMADKACALTSAAMVLKYFNITKTPGNPDTGLPPKDLDPGSLNEWLISVNDGSFRNGNTNFASIANMTIKSNELDPTSPKLEYSQSTNLSDIDEELNAGRKPILKLDYSPSTSGLHFVVATGSAESTYNILDPAHADRTTLSPHYQSPIRVDKFEVTNSDFSYLILVVDNTVDIQLLNSNNESVGQVEIEEPYFNQISQTPPEEETLKVLYFKHPPQGNYTLYISSPDNQPYRLDSYIYNQSGEKNLQTNTGVVGLNDTDTIALTVDSSATGSSEIKPLVTFDSLQADVTNAHELGWITNQPTYRTLLAEANAAEKLYNANRKQLAKMALKAMLTELKLLKGKTITEEGYNLLTGDLQSLQETL